MNTPSPFQKIQDWITQQWVILFGRKIDPEEDNWLMGPYGDVGETGKEFFHQLAKKEGLVIERNANSGIIPSIEKLQINHDLLATQLIHFYENTSSYNLNLSVTWNSLFKPFGYAIKTLFSRRLNQLNIPMKNSNSGDIKNEIIKLNDSKTNKTIYTIWYRTNLETNEIIYSGIYTTCQIPNGKTCVKAIFPLPNGSATIILKPSIGENGELILDATGEQFGQAGFYFLLKDSKGQNWSKYIRTFRDQLTVSESQNKLEAIQKLTLWHQKVLEFRYEIESKN